MDIDQDTEGESPELSPDERDGRRLAALHEQGDVLKMSASLQQRCSLNYLILKNLCARSDEVIGKSKAAFKTLPSWIYRRAGGSHSPNYKQIRTLRKSLVKTERDVLGKVP